MSLNFRLHVTHIGIVVVYSLDQVDNLYNLFRGDIFRPPSFSYVYGSVLLKDVK